MAEGRIKTIALPAVVDLDTLDHVRDTLLDAVESGPVTVNAGAVERVCTNALLLLVSAAETARRSSFSFEVSGVSEAMLSAIDRLGLKPCFAEMMKG
jgi:anti-anti-sigma regulatory factor